MNVTILSIIILLNISFCFGQTIKELESNIYHNDRFDNYSKIEEAKLLQTKNLELFNQKIGYLKKALEINRSNSNTVYEIARIYYKDFLIPFDEGKLFGYRFESLDITSHPNDQKKSIHSNSGDSALCYFKKLWEFNTEINKIIFFPIKQLESHIHNSDDSTIPDSLFEDDNCFFPSWYFASLPQNWANDNSINFLYEMETSSSESKVYAAFLANINEPCLFNYSGKCSEIIRFSWFRSFHNPIIIRIEKKNTGIVLYSKIVDKNENKIIEENKIEIPQKEWFNFLTLLNDIEIDSLPNGRYAPMLDGATWMLEISIKNRFKAHQTNIPEDKFKKCCLFLLKLSQISVREEDIY